MTKAFHVLVALSVAIPLGAGGLCCCLLGPTNDVAEAVAATPGRACCSAELPPAPSAPPCPATPGEDECGCPDRELAALTAVVDGKLVTTIAVVDHLVWSPSERPLANTVEEALPGPRILHPPRKTPLFRTLSVLLC